MYNKLKLFLMSIAAACIIGGDFVSSVAALNIMGIASIPGLAIFTLEGMKEDCNDSDRSTD